MTARSSHLPARKLAEPGAASAVDVAGSASTISRSGGIAGVDDHGFAIPMGGHAVAANPGPPSKSVGPWVGPSAEDALDRPAPVDPDPVVPARVVNPGPPSFPAGPWVYAEQEA